MKEIQHNVREILVIDTEYLYDTGPINIDIDARNINCISDLLRGFENVNKLLICNFAKEVSLVHAAVKLIFIDETFKISIIIYDLYRDHKSFQLHFDTYHTNLNDILINALYYGLRILNCKYTITKI